MIVYQILQTPGLDVSPYNSIFTWYNCVCTLINLVIQKYSFPDLMESQVVHLKEASSHQVSFRVSCEPPLAMTGGHVVSKETGTIRPQCVYVLWNTLYFQRVKRSDAGTYFIRSSNALLEGTASFKLRVKCKIINNPNAFY